LAAAHDDLSNRRLTFSEAPELPPGPRFVSAATIGAGLQSAQEQIAA